MTFIRINLISLQSATTFLVFTSARPEWDLFCLELKGDAISHLSSIIQRSLSSWNRMLRCDKAEEEADKKQVFLSPENIYAHYTQ